MKSPRPGKDPGPLASQIYAVVCAHPDGIKIRKIAAILNVTHQQVYNAGPVLQACGMLV